MLEQRPGMRRKRKRLVLRRVAALALVLGWASPALAHPHVWVTNRAELVFAQDGALTGIRHVWTFDEGYSAYATQGMVEGGKLDPAQARELAQTNIESLAESGYFTTLRAAGTRQEFETPKDAEIGLDGRRLTLSFMLPLKSPRVASRLMLDVYDPTFFVDFSLAEGDDAVRLRDAPAGCAVTVQRQKPEAAAAGKDLSEAFFEALTASGSNAGVQFGNRAMVACR
jgi:ABC-type uncharacterized transport system substrate-binding protein